MEARRAIRGDTIPPSSLPAPSIPDYLQPSIVEQDVSRYTVFDPAVWPFVQLRRRGELPSEQPRRIAAIEDERAAPLPHEWLLRWKLLECSTDRVPQGGALGRPLKTRLLELEDYPAGKQPIARGLGYLERRPIAGPEPFHSAEAHP